MFNIVMPSLTLKLLSQGLWANPKIHYRVPVDPVLNQMNLVNILRP
jgi:hypothetical protein